METPSDALLAQFTKLKMTHNALNQRATAVLAMAELVQDYRALAAQLLAAQETVLHDLNNCRQRLMLTPRPDEDARQDARTVPDTSRSSA